MKTENIIKVDLKIFDLDTVKQTIYLLPKGWYAELSCDDNYITVTFMPDNDREMADISPVISKFQRDLVDQDLRRKISKETESVRNLILSLAFSKTGLQS